MGVLLLRKLILITTAAGYYRRLLISPPLHFREGLLLHHVKEETTWEYSGSTVRVQWKYNGSTWEYSRSTMGVHRSMVRVHGSTVGVRREYGSLAFSPLAH